MAIEWATRIERPFTFEQLRAATENALRELLAMDDSRLAVALMSTEEYYAGEFPAWPKAVPAERLHAEHAQVPGHEADIVLILRELQAATAVQILDGGEEDPDDPDNPELGVRCGLSSQRDPVSCVLTIASAIAAARTTRSFVWDEGLTLSPDRISDPDRLMARLRLDAGDYRLEQAVNAVLERTQLSMRPDTSL